MSKTNITLRLEELLWNTIRDKKLFGCLEVTIGWFGKERVDCLTYDTTDIFRCFEIKSSKQDFYSKSKHTFVGHYNYYVTIQELYEQVKKDIPSHIGVYIEDKTHWKRNLLKSIKPAKKQDLGVSKRILKDSLIRSLSRDAAKYMGMRNKEVLIKEGQKLKIKNRDLEWEIENLRDELEYLRGEIKRKEGKK